MNITVPTIGESVSSGMLAAWLKKDGEYVKEGEELFELETDKANLMVPAPASGVLKRTANEGEEVSVGQVVGTVEAGERDAGGSARQTSAGSAEKKVETAPAGTETGTEKKPSGAETGSGTTGAVSDEKLSPSVRRIAVEENIDIGSITGTGKGGRITKEDALRAVENRIREYSPEEPGETGRISAAEEAGGKPGKDTGDKTRSGNGGTETGVTSSAGIEAAAGRETVPGRQAAPSTGVPQGGPRPQRRVPMTRIRQRIAENLVLSKHSSAHLTTFNELDMSAVMSLRSLHKDAFFEKHGTRLGFMSFFIRASCSALAEYPETNAFVEGTDIIYNDFYDIGVALSTDRGLMTPVVRGADRKSFAALEAEIVSFAERAKEKKIRPDELSGATFTITNGGVFGSLLSTPIPSPPQTAILGMHAIQKRPVVVNDQVVIRSMMYVALTYDHRIIDGKQAIGFLMTIKRLIEDPGRLLLDL